MGQTIEVEATFVGDTAVFSTDRSITGQDGVSYTAADEASADERFPGILASRLYEAVDGLTTVFVASNQVVARREGGWADDAAGVASGVIRDFFLFYVPTG